MIARSVFLIALLTIVGASGWVFQHFAFEEGLVRLRKNQPSEFCEHNRITEASPTQGELVSCTLSITAWENFWDALQHELMNEANLNSGLRYSKNASVLLIRDTQTKEILYKVPIEGQYAQRNASFGSYAVVSLPVDSASQHFQSTLWMQDEKTFSSLETFATQWNKKFYITNEGAYVFDGMDLIFYDFASKVKTMIANPLTLIPQTKKTNIGFAYFDIQSEQKLFFFSSIGSSPSVLQYYVYDLEKRTVASTDKETFNTKNVFQAPQPPLSITESQDQLLHLSDIGMEYSTPYIRDFYQDA